jgi:hypothetical protein
VLTAVLVAEVLAVPASAAPAQGSAEACVAALESEAAALMEAARCGGPVDITGLTSATVAARALPSGLVEATISAGVARVQRGEDWVPLDLTLHRSTDGSVTPAAHPNDLVLAGETASGTHDLAAVGRGDDRVAMRWTGALPTPVLDGPTATYPEARPGVDLVIEATPEGFEQFLVVKTRAAVSQVARIPLPLTGTNVASHEIGADGAVAVRDRSGDEIARVAPALMWDSRPFKATGEPGRSTLVRPEIAAPQGLARAAVSASGLVLTPDTVWMLDAGTVFPVVIDPVVTPVSSTFSTMVIERTTTDLSTQGDLWFGVTTEASPRKARSFVHWPSATVAGKQIVSATANFYNFYSTTCAAKSWEIWSTGAASTATRWEAQPAWLDADPDLAGDQPAAVSTQTAGKDATCDDGWIAIDAKRFFQRAADTGQQTAYMGLRASDETDGLGWKQVWSRNWAANTTVRPYVTVTYNSLPQVTARATVPATTCVTGSSRPLLQTMVPTLKATVSDAEGTAMGVTFEWWSLTGTSPVGAATVAGVATGGTASATVPVGSITRAGSYKWRVKTSDGTGSSTSPWCEFTLHDGIPPAEGCGAGIDSDFNGDGTRDIAIADPEATVTGLTKAGRIHIVDGSTGTATTVHQGLASVPGDVATGNRFGHALATYDANRDGCADLAVGLPFHDAAGAVDAGVVYVLLGSPAGLGAGPAALTVAQGSAGTPDTAEAGDWFGFALAAGSTTTGEPYLVIGAPGEDTGTAVDTGLVNYRRGTVNVTLDQAAAGFGDTNETDDRFGYAVAASAHHVAVGRPGESVNLQPFVGAFSVYSHDLVAGLLKLLGNLHQDSPNISGTAETGDQLGRALSIAAYRPVGAPVSEVHSLLAVGVPSEDLTVDGSVVQDAGTVMRFDVGATALAELPSVSHEANAGNYLGERVRVVNTAPGEESTSKTLFLAVGTPGKDRGDADDAGAVAVFGAATNPTGGASIVQRSSTSLPGAAIGGELLGAAIGASPQHLYIASPYRDRAVFAVPWAALATGSTEPSTAWRAGENGLPADAVAFGAALG